MYKTRNEFATELAKGSDISIPKAARVIDYMVQSGFDLKLSDAHLIAEPGWGRIMEFPLYEISTTGKIRSYYTKKVIPMGDDGDVILHDNDGNQHQLNIQDLLAPTRKAA